MGAPGSPRRASHKTRTKIKTTDDEKPAVIDEAFRQSVHDLSERTPAARRIGGTLPSKPIAKPSPSRTTPTLGTLQIVTPQRPSAQSQPESSILPFDLKLLCRYTDAERDPEQSLRNSRKGLDNERVSIPAP